MEIHEYIEKIEEIQIGLHDYQPQDRIQLTIAVLKEISKDERVKQKEEDRAKYQHQKQLSDQAPPTDKQKTWLEKMGKNPEDYKTKREASEELDKLFKGGKQ